MNRRLTAWAAVALAALCLTLLAAVAAAGETRHGTPFGDGRVRGALVGVAGEPDVDPFVAPCIAGERLTVVVTGKGGLLPHVTLLDPDGLQRDVHTHTGRRGRRVRVSRHLLDKTGPWTVRIHGDATQGRYAARFRVAPPPRVRERDVQLGGEHPATMLHAFDATDGSTLDLDVRWSREGVPVEPRRLISPTGEQLPLPAEATTRGRRRVRLRRLPLAAGTGTYAVAIGSSDGAGTYDLDLRVDGRPARPRGAARLDADEPFLVARGAPLEGRAGVRARLRGVGFSHDPLPRVFFGGHRATVASVSPHGLVLEVLPPPRPVGTVVDVAVVGVDGQAACRDAYFLYTEPPEPPPPADVVELHDLSPTTATLAAGATQEFTLRLSRTAERGGAVVRVVVTGGVGDAPDPVVVPAGEGTATFTLQAGDVATSGEVRASLVRTVAARVEVLADEPEEPEEQPDEIDLSGWTLRQTDAAASYEFATGTVVSEGGYVVVARDASRSAFENHWNVTLGDDVLFIDSADVLPRINGSEAYTLENSLGLAVDGPTVAMPSSAGRILRRLVPVGAAGESASWFDVASSVVNATPGGGQSTPRSPTGIYISEIGDATGSGNYGFEFVELHFDGAPD